MARQRAQPPIKMGFWKKDGKLWYAEPSDLRAAITENGAPDTTIQRRMGAGYRLIEDVLSGKRIDGWSVQHIEHGISKETPLPPSHSYPVLPVTT